MNLARGQAAIEFLLTNGWAILIVIILLATLFYIGVLNPQRLQPNICAFSPGFSCYNFRVGNGTGALELDFGQAIGKSIIVTSISCSENESAPFQPLNNSITVPSGEHRWVLGEDSGNNATCAGATGEAGDRYKGEVCVNYTESGTGTTRIVCGEINARLEPGPLPPTPIPTPTLPPGAIPLTSCFDVTAPGYYYLDADLNMSSSINPWCILVYSGGSSSTIDCKGHAITGPGTFGVYLYQPTNVTLKNCNIAGFSYGIYLISSSSNTIKDNNLYSNSEGIYLHSSSSNTFTGNRAFSNTDNGAYIIVYSSNNNFTGNTFTGNAVYGVYLTGWDSGNLFTGNNVSFNNASGIYLRDVWPSAHVFKDNTVKNNTNYDFECGSEGYGSDGGGNDYDKGDSCGWLGCQPTINTCCSIFGPGNHELGRNLSGSIYPWCIRVYSGGSNSTIDCKGHTISGGGWYGVDLESTTNVTVKNCNVTGFSAGIYLISSSSNTIKDNNLYSNSEGLYLYASSSNTFTGNKAFSNTDNGAHIIVNSYSNNFTGNTFTGNAVYGVYLTGWDSGNLFTGNNVSFNNASGIYLRDVWPSAHVFKGNTVKNNTNYDFECGPDGGGSDLGGNDYDKGDACTWLGCQPTINACCTIFASGDHELGKDLNSSLYPWCIRVSSSGSNSTIDCKGHTISVGGWYGIDLETVTNVTVENCNITGFSAGIFLSSSSGNTLRGNNLYSNSNGLFFYTATGNIVTGNNIHSNNNGADLSWSSNSNNFTGNNFTDNSNYGVYLGSGDNANDRFTGNNMSSNHGSGVYLGSTWPSTHFFTGNTVKGNTNYDFDCSGGGSATDSGGNDYDKGDSCTWLNCQPTINACCSIFTPGSHVLGKNLTAAVYPWCIRVYSGGSSSTINCNGYTITGPGWYGVAIESATGVTVENCNITGFTHGIYMYSSSGNTLRGNNLYSNSNGLFFYTATGNIVTGNNIHSNNNGADLSWSSNSNNFTGNNFTDNSNYGVYLGSGDNANDRFTGNNMSSNHGSGVYLGSTWPSTHFFTGNTVKGNTNYDFDCSGGGYGSDGGGNTCDSKDACGWVCSCPTDTCP